MPQWLEIALRTLVAVVTLFVLTRLLGKRQVNEMSLFEYITGITIGSLAAYISLDLEAGWYLGLVALSVWVAVSLGIEYLQLKSKKVRDWLDGKPTVLIQDGKIFEENMRKERLTSDELMQLLRRQRIFRVADVEFAVMETNGSISVLPKKEHQPLTPAALGLKAGADGPSQTVAMDGKMMNESLASAGLHPNWLKAELERMDVAVEDVFLAQVDADGQLYVDLFDDSDNAPKPPKPQS